MTTGVPGSLVIHLGTRVCTLTGPRSVAGLGPKIAQSVNALAQALLLHESLVCVLVPPRAGMRRSWREFVSLETWARSERHTPWRKRFLRNSGGTGSWHDAYFLRGVLETKSDDMVRDAGRQCFAPRARRPWTNAAPAPRGEDEIDL